MSQKNKLKREKVTSYAIAFVIIAVMVTGLSILENEFFGTRYVSWLYGLIFLVFGYLFYRVIYMPSQWSRFMIFLLYILIGTSAWHYELAMHYRTFLTRTTYDIHIFSFLALAVVLVPYMVVNKSKMKTHFRKLFELAAQPVEEATNGYSSRPFPAGKESYTRDEILAFGRFLERKMIVVMHEFDHCIVFSFTALSSLIKPDPENSSCIRFDESGNVLVTIRREDYLQYKDQLSFDELCQSMASLFIRFLKLYREGKEAEILRMLDAMEPRYLMRIKFLLVILLLIGVLVTLILWYVKSS